MMQILNSEKEKHIIERLISSPLFNADESASIVNKAKDFIRLIRGSKKFSIEKFMQSYSLSTTEGIAVMGLAEGLLRIPDQIVANELVSDKLAEKNWESHLGQINSIKGQAISLGLYGAGNMADLIGIDNIITKIINKVTGPVFLVILKRAIKILGKEFIFGSDIQEGLKTLEQYPGYLVSFDLLGESARTSSKAEQYYDEYLKAIELIAQNNNAQKGSSAVANSKNISVKFTALYPRFELSKIEDIEEYLFPKLVVLVKKIKEAELTITFDAEEARRLDIYLHIFTKLILHPDFKDFHGICCVIQGYQTRSYQVINYIIDLAKTANKKIPVRLVKGAYWDYEIKYAQENNLEYYPVFTKKEYTDYNYLVVARAMLEHEEYIYPCFATHNALTAATIIQMAGDKDFEFQKLHGMGKVLHDELVKNHKVRIYAPVGKTYDLLAYLMRRLLENGANACFVNQVNNTEITVEELVYNINEKILEILSTKESILLPKNIYPNRESAMGNELGHKADYDEIYNNVSKFYNKIYKIGSIINGNEILNKRFKEHFCPAKFVEKIGEVTVANEEDLISALEGAKGAFEGWTNTKISVRSAILRKIAALYEENKYELYSLLITEAGKTIKDAINEVIEAIDFCRYYANQAELHMAPKILPSPTGEENTLTMHGRGVFLCISPWNFPLAIFTGQIVAALVCANTVIAKPADQTPIIANFAIKLMHKAGVPKSVLHLVISSGANVGNILVPSEEIAGITFTGSSATAKIINLALANRNNGIIPFIAETGGQNAMIVDSSALLEQVTDDVLTSAFYSAGQRCSALRILYIQEEIYESLIEMIKGAMELLKIDDNADFSTDVGPVINKASMENLAHHIDDMRSKGFKVIGEHPRKGANNAGYFFYPHIIAVNSISDIPDEKFGPILHVAKYQATELDKIINDINSCGFGLTFGIHSRIEKKIEYISSKMRVGNIYANRSIVGAVVESQPFGGENKSGTGFKAGGPHYLLKFLLERTTTINTTAIGGNIELLKS
jgi:RHH-type transcriptional regulator, proline utilization regulon repressor / proline dehydrogenase / delta 1-pyrroline-5-carboxylate dehydrogenase